MARQQDPVTAPFTVHSVDWHWSVGGFDEWNYTITRVDRGYIAAAHGPWGDGKRGDAREFEPLGVFRSFARARTACMDHLGRLRGEPKDPTDVSEECPECGEQLAHVAGPGAYRARLCTECDRDALEDEDEDEGRATPVVTIEEMRGER